MIRVAPCTRLHPGWRRNEDYGGHATLQGEWQVVGPDLPARHVVHDPPSYDGICRLPTGAVVRCLGSRYVYNGPFEIGEHVVQLLDAGPAPEPGNEDDARPRTHAIVGDCYEVSEYIDDDTVVGLWPARFVGVTVPEATRSKRAPWASPACPTG